MTNTIPKTITKCLRPTSPGLYVCRRVQFNWSVPALVEIRRFDERLHYIGGNSSFPLDKLEDSAIFWGPIVLD